MDTSASARPAHGWMLLVLALRLLISLRVLILVKSLFMTEHFAQAPCDANKVASKGSENKFFFKIVSNCTDSVFRLTF